jgi:allantoin racemase
MRLLLANPNTTEAVTEIVAAAARRVAAPGTEILPCTARIGAAVIGTRAELAIAEHASLDLLARKSPGCDAAIIAASTDSGLRAARELLAIPVLGLTESALHVACLAGGRFGTVTLSARSAATLREMIEGYGLASRCAGQRFADATPQKMLADPGAVAALVAAEAEALVGDGADAVVLIGAVMADMAAAIAPLVGVPVVEGVAAAVVLAEALVRLRLPKPRAGSFAAPSGRASSGLDPALAALLMGTP